MARVIKEKQVDVTSGIYGLGFIGAIIFFIQTADSFGEGLLGVLKAIVWPAFLVYQAFEFLMSQ